MSRRSHHSAWQVYSDVLMCVLCFTVMAMAMLMLAVNPKTKGSGDVHPKAEFLVTLTWDDKRDVDLDLWLKDPDGDFIMFKNKEAPNINLDRDSRGFTSNLSHLPDGTSVLSSNQEIISIRAIIPGEYIVAVNYYSGDTPPAIDAKVQVQKVNPVVTEIANNDMHFTRVHESQNAICFRIDNDGSAAAHPCTGPNMIDEFIGNNVPGGIL
jgi:uncharacterized protein YfaP (DUF2135 family)